MKKKLLSVILALALCIGLAVPASAFIVYSGYGWLPQTYISSPDGQIMPDLEQLYPVWKAHIESNYSESEYPSSREDFLREIGGNSFLYDNPDALAGLTFQQATDKLAEEMPREWQFVARCALAIELSELDILTYKINIPDISKLDSGNLSITIESVRGGLRGVDPDFTIPGSRYLEPVTVTKSGAEIPAETTSQGQLWSEFWKPRINDNDVFNGLLEELVDGPMSVTRTYSLPVSAGPNEFIINDGIDSIKLVVNVALGRDPQPDAPSSWAKEEVDAAIEAGLVPENLQKDYTRAVSRGDVAQMFINLIEKASDQTIDEFMAAKGVTINNDAFTDTTDKAVLAANALEIINGVGDGRFDPGGTLTRAQIAAIINRVARAVGLDTEGYSHSFDDVAGHWVNDELGWPVYADIIRGLSETSFDPSGNLTTEQAIAITYRALAPLSE